MNPAVRLAVDCMGGDIGPSATLPACRAFAQSHPDVELLLVGAPEVLARHGADRIARAQVVAASEVVAMDDPVEVALRKKKDSSMRVAISQLRPGEAQAADACISAGNTGALMALSKYLLKTVPGIDRPAIASLMPNVKGGSSVVLDLGANVDCGPEHLLQFAVMGAALAAAIQGKENASVGLLNVGEEVIKGSETIKKAGELLRNAANAGDLNFYGNVEGNDIFKGTTDVVVCDGFVGNVALKTAEGLAQMLAMFLKESFTSSNLGKLTGFIALRSLTAFKNKVDHRRYNGAALLGLNGLVFKSHGSADAYAFEQALSRAYDAARHQLHRRVQERIAVTWGHRASTAS